MCRKEYVLQDLLHAVITTDYYSLRGRGFTPRLSSFCHLVEMESGYFKRILTENRSVPSPLVNQLMRVAPFFLATVFQAFFRPAGSRDDVFARYSDFPEFYNVFVQEAAAGDSAIKGDLTQPQRDELAWSLAQRLAEGIAPGLSPRPPMCTPRKSAYLWRSIPPERKWLSFQGLFTAAGQQGTWGDSPPKSFAIAPDTYRSIIRADVKFPDYILNQALQRATTSPCTRIIFEAPDQYRPPNKRAHRGAGQLSWHCIDESDGLGLRIYNDIVQRLTACDLLSADLPAERRAALYYGLRKELYQGIGREYFSYPHTRPGSHGGR